MNWGKYNRYFRDCEFHAVADANEATSRSGYGVSASDAHVVFKACPPLKRLSIEIDCRSSNRPQGHNVNSAVYGDEFWEAVAEYCPQLQSIEMMDCSNYQNFNIQSVSGLSDRTLLALSSLKHLKSVEFCATRLTGKGIFEWLSRVSKLTEPIGDERTLGVRLGGHQRTRLASPSFYAKIVELLRLLSETSEESLGAASCRAKPLLFVTNLPLLEAVKVKYPSLSLDVSMFGRQENKFNRIETLTLDWRLQDRKRDRGLFFDYLEEEAERETYRDASRYKIVSDNEGDVDEEENGDVATDAAL